MTDRSEAFEGVQLGLEAIGAPGVVVAANRRLLGVGITLSPQTENQEGGPRGNKYNTYVLNNKEWSAGSIDGVGAFNDLYYLLCGAFGDPTLDPPPGATLSKGHVWSPEAWQNDNGRTFTIDAGSPVRAERFANVFIQALGMTFNRTGVSVNGSVFGQRIEDGVTITPTPTDVVLEPMPASGVNFYLDDAPEDLGTTQLLRAMEGSFNFSDKKSAFWPMNRTLTSFGGAVETKTTAEAGLTLGADAVGMGLLSDMRSGVTKFLRIEVEGPIIEAAISYSFTADLAIKILNPNDRGASDGLLTQPWAFRVVYDGDWGKPAEFKLVDTIATP